MLTIVMNSVPVKPGSPCDCRNFKIVCARVRVRAHVCVCARMCARVCVRVWCGVEAQVSHLAAVFSLCPMGTSSAVTLVGQLHYLYQHHLPRHFEQW